MHREHPLQGLRPTWVPQPVWPWLPRYTPHRGAQVAFVPIVAIMDGLEITMFRMHLTLTMQASCGCS